MLRSCYRTQMRFYPNRPDVLTDVVWSRVPDGTPFVPFFNPFGSAIWDDPHEALDTSLGEVWQTPISWYNGRPVATWPAAMPCGSAADWADGITYPPSPLQPIPPGYVPTCCTSTPPPPDPCSAMSWEFNVTGNTGAEAPYNGLYFTNPAPAGPCFWQNFTGFGHSFWSMGRDPAMPSSWFIQGLWDTGPFPAPNFAYRIPIASINANVLGTTVVPIDPAVIQSPGNAPTVLLTRVS